MATVHARTHRGKAYQRAADAILRLDWYVDRLVQADGSLPKIAGIGPATTRVMEEALRTGGSKTVEDAIDSNGRRAEVDAARTWRRHFLSRARALAILADRRLAGPSRDDYRGDLQMHSTASDGSQSLEDIVSTGLARGYAFAAVTDHSAGLRIASGVSPEGFVQQAAEIAAINRRNRGRFRLLRGVEANITGDGQIDVDVTARARFDIVVAAPHSGLRSETPQTSRMIRAVTSAHVHILGHPRGRKFGTRPGIVADWKRVFEAAAASDVAVEIDGDPARQDFDHDIARQALDAGCLFALDSDAHAVSQWDYTDFAIAHARLAGIPPDRIINCWELDRLLDWAKRRRPKS